MSPLPRTRLLLGFTLGGPSGIIESLPIDVRKAILAMCAVRLYQLGDTETALKVAAAASPELKEKIELLSQARDVVDKLANTLRNFAKVFAEGRITDLSPYLHDIVVLARRAEELSRKLGNSEAAELFGSLAKTFEVIRGVYTDMVDVTLPFSDVMEAFVEGLRSGDYEALRRVYETANTFAGKAESVARRLEAATAYAPEQVLPLVKQMSEYYTRLANIYRDVAFIAYQASRIFEGIKTFGELLSKYGSSPEYTFRNRAYWRQLADAIGTVLDAYKNLIEKVRGHALGGRGFTLPELDRIAYTLATAAMEYLKRVKSALIEQPPRDEWRSVFEEAERLYGVTIPVEKWSWPEPPKDALRSIAYWTVRLLAVPFEKIVELSKAVEDWAMKLHEEAWRESLSPSIFDRIAGYVKDVIAGIAASFAALGSGTALKQLQAFIREAQEKGVHVAFANFFRELAETITKHPALAIGALIAGALIGRMVGPVFRAFRVPPRLQPVLMDILFGNPPGVSMILGKIAEPVLKRLGAIPKAPELRGSLAIPAEGARVEVNLELVGRSEAVAEGLRRLVESRVGELEKIVPGELKARLRALIPTIIEAIRDRSKTEAVKAEMRKLAIEALKATIEDVITRINEVSKKIPEIRAKLAEGDAEAAIRELKSLGEVIKHVRKLLSHLKLLSDEELEKLAEAEKAVENLKPLTALDRLTISLKALVEELSWLGRELKIPEAEELAKLWESGEKPVEKLEAKKEALGRIVEAYTAVRDALRKMFSTISERTLKLFEKLKRRKSRLETLYGRLLSDVRVWIRERVETGVEEVELPELKSLAELLKESLDGLPPEARAKAMKLIPRLEEGRLSLNELRDLADVLAKLEPSLKALPYLEAAREVFTKLRTLLEKGAEIEPKLLEWSNEVLKLDALVKSRCAELRIIDEILKSGIPSALDEALRAILERLEKAGVREAREILNLWERIREQLAKEGVVDRRLLKEFIRRVSRLPAAPKSLKARLMSIAERLKAMCGEVPWLREFADQLLDIIKMMQEYPDNYVAVKIGLGKEIVDPVALPEELLPEVARLFEPKEVVLKLGDIGEVKVKYIPRVEPEKGMLEVEIRMEAPDGAVVRYILRRTARWVKTREGWKVETKFTESIVADPPDSPLAAMLLENAARLAEQMLGDRLRLMESLIVLPDTPAFPPLNTVFAYPAGIVTREARMWAYAFTHDNSALVDMLLEELKPELRSIGGVTGYWIPGNPPIAIVTELDRIWEKLRPVTLVLIRYRGQKGIGVLVRLPDGTPAILIPDIMALTKLSVRIKPEEVEIGELQAPTPEETTTTGKPTTPPETPPGAKGAFTPIPGLVAIPLSVGMLKGTAARIRQVLQL